MTFKTTVLKPPIPKPDITVKSSPLTRFHSDWVFKGTHRRKPYHFSLCVWTISWLFRHSNLDLPRRSTGRTIPAITLGFYYKQPSRQAIPITFLHRKSLPSHKYRWFSKHTFTHLPSPEHHFFGINNAIPIFFPQLEKHPDAVIKGWLTITQEKTKWAE